MSDVICNGRRVGCTRDCTHGKIHEYRSSCEKPCSLDKGVSGCACEPITNKVRPFAIALACITLIGYLIIYFRSDDASNM